MPTITQDPQIQSDYDEIDTLYQDALRSRLHHTHPEEYSRLASVREVRLQRLREDVYDRQIARRAQ